ncbi:MAG: hypothetical protein IKZ14_05075 [Muribaculaceae bacterium]|nr:hypothetical protein [Muribaculaceae bacterium]
MEKIYLDDFEKELFRNVCKGDISQPRNLSLNQFHYSLSTLQEKGLIIYKTEYDKIIDIKPTIKGLAYLDTYPRLPNPIDWRWITSIVLSAITTTTLALFIACNMN